MLTGAALAQTNAPAQPPVAVATPAAPAAGAGADMATMPGPSSADFWRRELATARRIVDGRTYDISSLVRWQMQPDTQERPLKAWVLVVGTVGANTAYGWEITGFLDGQRQPGPFILRSPPADLIADFNRRKATLAAVRQRQTRAQAELRRAQTLLTETEEAFRRAAVFRVAGDLLDLRGQDVKDREADATAADEAARTFDSGGLDLDGPFVLRCFAMKTVLTLNRRPVYDHGSVLK